MSNGSNINFQYKINNTTITRPMKLNLEENLEKNFHQFKILQNDNELNKRNDDYIFHLIKDNTKTLLDKNIKVKDLNLREGDIILVYFYPLINEIENIQHISNVSSANLTEEMNSSSNHVKPLCSKKTKYILIIISIILVLA